MDGLRSLAALGVPMGVVSNSDGRLQAQLVRLAVCYVPGRNPEGRRHGTRGRRARRRRGRLHPGRGGQARSGHLRPRAGGPSGCPPAGAVLHVGDSLRSDVDGALAAGLQPVHLDPYGFCPSPDGHGHVRSLAELAQAVAGSGARPWLPVVARCEPRDQRDLARRGRGADLPAARPAAPGPAGGRPIPGRRLVRAGPLPGHGGPGPGRPAARGGHVVARVPGRLPGRLRRGRGAVPGPGRTGRRRRPRAGPGRTSARR